MVCFIEYVWQGHVEPQFKTGVNLNTSHLQQFFTSFRRAFCLEDMFYCVLLHLIKKKKMKGSIFILINVALIDLEIFPKSDKRSYKMHEQPPSPTTI